MGKLLAFPGTEAEVLDTSGYDDDDLAADLCGDGADGSTGIFIQGPFDEEPISQGGSAWRRHQIKAATALIDVRNYIEGSSILTDIWRKTLFDFFHFVRNGAIPPRAFMKIIELSEEYVRLVATSTIPDNTTPGQFIRTYMTVFLMEKQRAHIEAINLRATKVDEEFVAEERARRERTAKKRREGIKIVK